MQKRLRLRKPEQGECGRSVEGRISDLTDKVDSVAAAQMPMIDAVERMQTTLGAFAARDKFKIEENLKNILGWKVYSSLCDDARNALIEAERQFMDQGVVDWNSAVACIGRAFEQQLKQYVLPALAEHLRAHGLMTFPNGEKSRSGKPIPAIIEHGRANQRAMLAWISMSLELNNPLLEEFARKRNIDISALKKSINGVMPDRNLAVHGSGMNFANASRVRGQWLGIGNTGSIFAAMCPRN